MLGCIGLKCNEREAMANEEKHGGEAEMKAVADDGNDLVAEPLTIDTSAANEPPRQGRCPFKQCISDTFSPCRHHKSDDPIAPTKTEERSTEASVNVDDATDQRPKSPVITGITTTKDIIHKRNSTAETPSDNPVITGITSIDAIINTLSNSNRKDPVTDLDRNAQILEQLGILHLQDKLTRPRKSQETDEYILREAGAARHLDDDDSVSNNGRHEEEAVIKSQKEVHQKKLDNMSDRELQILEEAGVTMPTSHVVNSPNIQNCFTETTMGLTTLQMSESCLTSPTFAPDQGLNHTYAEKELLRRLKNGWASNGSDCPECGMPIIYKMEGDEGLMECVICGILESNEVGQGMVRESFSNFDTTISSGMAIANQYGEVNHQGRAVASPTGMSIHEHQVASPTGMSVHDHVEYAALEQCASCQDEVTSHDSTIFGQNHQPHCTSCERSMIEKCKSDLALQDDDALKKELGKRIFAGWTLLSLNCPCCNLPLISEGKGSPSICLRCG